jgi:hypothetical protein
MRHSDKNALDSEPCSKIMVTTKLFDIHATSVNKLNETHFTYPVESKHTPLLYMLNPVARLYRSNKIYYLKKVPIYRSRLPFTGFILDEL